MTVKKIPMRMCVGCSQMKPKKELIRVVKSPEGEISLDLTGKKSGRGAYVCPEKECLQKAVKSRRLDRTLGCTVPQDLYEKMEEQLGK